MRSGHGSVTSRRTEAVEHSTSERRRFLLTEKKRASCCALGSGCRCFRRRPQWAFASAGRDLAARGLAGAAAEFDWALAGLACPSPPAAAAPSAIGAGAITGDVNGDGVDVVAAVDCLV